MKEKLRSLSILQWFVIAIIIALIVIPAYTYRCPQICYQTDEYVERYEGRQEMPRVECYSDPSNPAWVRFIVDNDLGLWFLIASVVLLIAFPKFRRRKGNISSSDITL